MKNTIDVKNVSKTYPGFQLDNISFTIPEGMIVGLIGENGAGKTTTLKAILNMIEVDGDIKVFGKDIKKNEKAIKEELGVVLDDSFLSEYLTAKQMNKVMKQFYKTWDEDKYFEYLKEFQLPEGKLVKEFSSGMKMKLKIATALSHHPKALILDEATSGLDPIIRNEILDIFRKYILEEESRSVLLSSHITTDLEQIADYIIFIHQGKIVFFLPATDLLENYGIVKCDEKEFQHLEKKDYISYRKDKYSYQVLVSDKDRVKKKYKFTVIDKPSIEDIMLFYVKGEGK